MFSTICLTFWHMYTHSVHTHYVCTHLHMHTYAANPLLSIGFTYLDSTKGGLNIFGGKRITPEQVDFSSNHYSLNNRVQQLFTQLLVVPHIINNSDASRRMCISYIQMLYHLYHFILGTWTFVKFGIYGGSRSNLM